MSSGGDGQRWAPAGIGELEENEVRVFISHISPCQIAMVEYEGHGSCQEAPTPS